MSRTPPITPAEWDVMDALWTSHPATAQDVHAALEPRTGWSQRTVKTLLGRLVKKRALAFEPDGKRYLYSPAVAREDCVLEEGRALLERARGGAESPLLAYLFRESDLSAEELAALKRLIAEREEGAR